MNSLILTQDDWNKQIQSFKQGNKMLKSLLEQDVDYGIIPGTVKPTLYKSGAEKTARFFKVHVEYSISKENLENGHVEYDVDSFVKVNESGLMIGQGTGSCTTMESKYKMRKLSRVCPVCSKEAIIKGKAEYGGGWVCFKRKGGCGAKFHDEAPEIINQKEGYEEYSNPADYRNTVKKMAKKRAYVDGIITALGLDMTQDLDEVLENMFAQSEKAPSKDTDDFQEIKEALDKQGIDRSVFADWIKKMYGKDVESIRVLRVDKEKILDTINEHPSDICL